MDQETGAAAEADLHGACVEAANRLADASATDVIAWAVAAFGRRLAVTSSMTDPVVPHLVAQLLPGVDVLFIDTGYHFKETLATRDVIASTLPIHVFDVRPALTVTQQAATYGPDLFARDPDRCCALRKVVPLDDALDDYDVWVTGVRREEAPTRDTVGPIEWDARRHKIKLNPIAAWTAADVAAYISTHRLRVNPLVTAGYPSIGCWPCTSAVAEQAHPRSGRWTGTAKVECGLHS
jgi:phosphoadenosine phosphosulfate reductase